MKILLKFIKYSKVNFDLLSKLLKVLCIPYTCGILAQLGEHLPYKQRVTGSSPVGPILMRKHKANAGVAELADAQDLKSCGTNLPYRFDSGRRHL